MTRDDIGPICTILLLCAVIVGVMVVSLRMDSEPTCGTPMEWSHPACEPWASAPWRFR